MYANCVRRTNCIRCGTVGMVSEMQEGVFWIIIFEKGIAEYIELTRITEQTAYEALETELILRQGRQVLRAGQKTLHLA